MLKTPHFHCRGHGFDSWLGKQDPACRVAWPQKKINKKGIVFVAIFKHNYHFDSLLNVKSYDKNILVI